MTTSGSWFLAAAGVVPEVAGAERGSLALRRYSISLPKRGRPLQLLIG